MKAEELRIGNLVMCNNEVTIVYSINDIGIGLECQTGRYGGMDYDGTFVDSWATLYPKISPIPLDEQWLLKFGFEKIKEHSYIFEGKERFRISLDYTTTDEYFQTEYKMPHTDWKVLDIKYVHQLQNLNYVLTGTELTIKD